MMILLFPPFFVLPNSVFLVFGDGRHPAKSVRICGFQKHQSSFRWKWFLPAMEVSNGGPPKSLRAEQCHWSSSRGSDEEDQWWGESGVLQVAAAQLAGDVLAQVFDWAVYLPDSCKWNQGNDCVEEPGVKAIAEDRNLHQDFEESLAGDEVDRRPNNDRLSLEDLFTCRHCRQFNRVRVTTSKRCRRSKNKVSTSFVNNFVNILALILPVSFHPNMPSRSNVVRFFESRQWCCRFSCRFHLL